MNYKTLFLLSLQAVCQKLGIDVKDRLQCNSKKLKFLVKGPLPRDDLFPKGSQDFTVIHDYLQSSSPKMQVRLRKRGQKVQNPIIQLKSEHRIGLILLAIPGSLELLLHRSASRVRRSSGRGSNSPHPKGLQQHVVAKGAQPRHSVQRPALLSPQRPILPAGHLQGAMSPKVRIEDYGITG